MLKNIKKRNTTDVRMAYFMSKHLADAMQAN